VSEQRCELSNTRNECNLFLLEASCVHIRLLQIDAVLFDEFCLKLQRCVISEKRVSGVGIEAIETQQHTARSKKARLTSQNVQINVGGHSIHKLLVLNAERYGGLERSARTSIMSSNMQLDTPKMGVD
jgi:hypothetical protein